VAWRVDENPTVLLYGETALSTTLSTGSTGASVAQLESNLAALGYDVTVDEDYTSETANAVEAWQNDLGVEQTGEVEVGAVTFADGAQRVDQQLLGVGDSVSDGSSMLTVTGDDPTVEISVSVDQLQGAELPIEVSIELPDGTVVGGSASTVEPSATQEGDNWVQPVIVLFDDPSMARSLAVGTPVSVVVTTGSADDALIVPVGALHESNGSPAVTIVGGDRSETVAVVPGIEADASISVESDALTEGDEVAL
jgi:peptidoglycan hydrolase-like protein with peptidoglycan-binding domain